MSDYYSERLSAERLRRCYELAGPAVRRYLDGEIRFLVSRLSRSGSVLELGCGYGRVLLRLIPHARAVFGIDTSLSSLQMAKQQAGNCCTLAVMDAAHMAFSDSVFDVVACVQNGISAFGVDPLALFREAARVTREGGRILFSSYSPHFWPYRLAWFEAQSEAGLIGEIDRQRTGNGVIVCKDGFRATTATAEDFRRLASAGGFPAAAIHEVEDSSVFCELRKVPRRG